MRFFFFIQIVNLNESFANSRSKDLKFRFTVSFSILLSRFAGLLNFYSFDCRYAEKK